MTVQELMQKKEKLEKLKAQHASDQGAMETLMAQLKDEFECDSIEDANDLIITMKSNLVDEEKKINEMVADWESKYSDLINQA